MAGLLLSLGLAGHLVHVSLLLALELLRAGADVVELALRLGGARGAADGGAGEHDLRCEGQSGEAQHEREEATHAAILPAARGGRNGGHVRRAGQK